MLAEEILEMIKLGESSELECKLARNTLPKDVWETYSAFANTNGGVILLGVKENKGEFLVEGADVVNLQKDFWDNINNPQKVNINILRNENVFPVKVGDKTILQINVPRAMRQQKPVSVHQNIYHGTYKRNHEGDYRCTKEEVDTMIAESLPETLDSKVAENSRLDDINLETLKNYRQIFVNKKPDSDWNSLNDKEFLMRIGAWKLDRTTNLEGLTYAGLVCFGTEMSITSYIPKYLLDYREKLSSIPDQRWSHRITSQDGTWSGNVIDFYHKVIKRINEDVEVPFVLEGDNLSRTTDTRVHKALREALLNTLIHADYFGSVNIVIEKEEHKYSFTNPGLLRVPLEKAIEGGSSDARNRFIFKIFSQLGYGEQSGYGLESIHNTWKAQQWERPTIIESFQPESVSLKLQTTSIIPEELSRYLKYNLKDRYYQLSSDEIKILVKICIDKSTTNTKVQEILGQNSLEVNKLLTNLLEEGLILKNGQGRGTEYILSTIFCEENEPQNNTEEINELKEWSELYAELKGKVAPIEGRKRVPNPEMKKVILDICRNHFLTLQQVATLVGKEESHLRKAILGPLVDDGKLELRYPDIRTHRNQAYKTKE